MEITLEEAFAGKTAQVRIPTSVTCEACSGAGRQGRLQAENLSDLRRRRQGAPHPGLLHPGATCVGCQGRGQVIDNPCPNCSVRGRVTRERTLSVNVPPGVEDGTRIRLGGEGEAGVRGGPNGDLYIFLSLSPHQFFQRDGADLHCRVPISMVAAALGGNFDVPTIDGGQTKVKVPEGHPAGPPLPSRRQGHAGAAYARARRHVRASDGGDAAEAQQASKGAAGRIRQAFVERDPAGSRRILLKVKDFLDGLGNRQGSA
jgi:molecular chaperone DnaJ